MEMQSDAALDMPGSAVQGFYLHALDLMDRSGVRYTVGGGYAMACHTGIVRHTKDLDVFVKAQDRDRVLDEFSRSGYRTEITWPHFLAKALAGDAFVDIIYNSSNGLCPVDDRLLDMAVEGNVLGRPVPLCPVEEMIWSKAFVQSRDRFDGADVLHLIRARAEQLDWVRLCERFRGHEAVLLAHLILFEYVYPSERGRVPAWVSERLLNVVRPELADQKVCRGTNLSNDQYHCDVTRWGYADARLLPIGTLTPAEIASLSPRPPPATNPRAFRL